MLRFFIDRPVFASVIAIIIVLAGLAAGRTLPVAQYPDILPPQVFVSASYPGAGAAAVAESVASPIETYIDGVDNMVYMRSISRNDGSMELVVTFEVGTDPDLATIKVANEVSGAMGRLPATVVNSGISVTKRSPALLQMITFSSSDGSLSPQFISDWVYRNVYSKIRRSPGVGDQTLFGAQIYAMRIWLDPAKMAKFGVTPGDIKEAVQGQNSQFAGGVIGGEPMEDRIDFTYAVITPERFTDAKQFEKVILRSAPDGSALRLGDVARVELGSHGYTFSAAHNGTEAVPIGIYLAPGANALATARGVEAIIERMEPRFPKSLEYSLAFDTTTFIEEAIHEVIVTLVIALILVVAMTYLFLQTLRASIIPIVAVPVSLVGTLVGMYLFGFSANLLTLFGLVLAIGIVVDDAIIVLENTERNIRDEGLTPLEAARRSTDEVSAPIIAMTLAVIAVFVPVAFIGGLSGVMYQQFAVTIAVAVTVSGVVALILSPTMCARFLSAQEKTPARPFRWFNQAFDRLTDVYMRGVGFLLRRSGLGMALFALVLASIWLLFSIVPAELVPAEDKGYVFATAQLPPASSLQRTEKVMDALERKILEYDAVEHLVTFTGMDLISGGEKTDSGSAYVTLKNWSERGPAQSSEAIIARIERDGAHIEEAKIRAFSPPPITGISTTGGFTAYLQSQKAVEPEVLLEQTRAFLAVAKKRPELADVRTTLALNVPRYEASVDREQAFTANVPLEAVFAAMRSTFGYAYINDFNLYGRIMRVYMQAKSEFRETPEDLDEVFVRSTDGSFVPLSTLVDLKRTQGADEIIRYNVFPAAQILGEPAPGYSSGEAIAAMDEVAEQVLSDDYLLGWSGAAYQQRQVAGASTVAFVLGVVFVLLVLAAQFERWSMPLVVLMTVPFGVFGALLAIWLAGIENGIYFQVGLLVLIALAAKNAILIVEFAMLKREQGMPAKEAAMEASRLRFRPVIMTSMTFILGAVPLAIATGAGANSQRAIGTAVIGGMLSATFLALLFVPMFYYLVTRASERLRGGDDHGQSATPAHD